jgi:uncharacterized protein
MKRIPISFPSGSIALEGEWALPDGDGPFPAVVVCHPHPPSGGNMWSGVVAAIWQALAQQGIAAFRFNFRGVGASHGSFSGGAGEREDVEAALDFLVSSAAVDRGRVGLAGYSFGAMMALAVAIRDDRVSKLALVSAPLSDGNWEEIKKYARPKLYVVGDSDQMIPLERVREKTADISDHEDYRIIQGADHFWGGHENEVGRWVAAFFSEGWVTPRV